STSKIIIGDVYNPGSGQSLNLSCWVKLNSSGTFLELVTKNGYDVIGWRFFKYSADNKFYFQAGNNCYGPAITDTKWHFFVLQREISGSSEITRIYIDGILAGSNSGTIYNVTNSQNLCIGCLHTSGSGYLRFHNGMISDVKIDYEIWSPGKIKNEYSKAKGFF
ncbi:MAG: LamG-like jellyroll fold domain-containing protein, partial [Bacteroidota bacterium]